MGSGSGSIALKFFTFLTLFLVCFMRCAAVWCIPLAKITLKVWIFSLKLIRQFCTHSRCDITPAGFNACFLLGESQTLINRCSPSLTPPCLSHLKNERGGGSQCQGKDPQITEFEGSHIIDCYNVQILQSLTRTLHIRILRKHS